MRSASAGRLLMQSRRSVVVVHMRVPVSSSHRFSLRWASTIAKLCTRLPVEPGQPVAFEPPERLESLPFSHAAKHRADGDEEDVDERVVFRQSIRDRPDP